MKMKRLSANKTADSWILSISFMSTSTEFWYVGFLFKILQVDGFEFK